MGVEERSIDVNNIKMHPLYKDPQQYFDVALIFLDEVKLHKNHIIISLLLSSRWYSHQAFNQYVFLQNQKQPQMQSVSMV